MDFTVTSLRAEESIGFGLATSETAALYRCWWLLGHLLGIDARDAEQWQRHRQKYRAESPAQLADP
jgi:hypothetical protein